jgi:hypothetical protein
MGYAAQPQNPLQQCISYSTASTPHYCSPPANKLPLPLPSEFCPLSLAPSRAVSHVRTPWLLDAGCWLSHLIYCPTSPPPPIPHPLLTPSLFLPHQAAEAALADPWVRHGERLGLQRRVLRLGKPPRRWKRPSWAAAALVEPPVKGLQGRPLAKVMGKKSR